MTLSGGGADQLALLLLAVAVTVLVLAAFRASPRFAFTCWVLTVAFVPVWFALPIVVSWVPASVVGLMVLATNSYWAHVRLGLPDALSASFFAACLIPVLIPGGSSTASLVVALAQWGVAFTLGRLLPGSVLTLRWMYSLIAIVMALVAALALVEFFLHWNPFVELNSPWALRSNHWRELQVRGGITRAEGAFGHSIALGCSLALAVPLAAGSTLKVHLRSAVIVLLMLGSVVSFSRLGMSGAVLGLLLSVLAGVGLTPRFRATALVAVGVVSLVVLPRVLDIFEAARDESTGSANYRLDLLSLLPSMTFLGFSPDARISPGGVLTFLQYESIDSALILMGLVYGWFALVVAVALLVLAVRSILVREAEPPTIAVVAQIPALMTVALITQYAMFFWFVAGMAVAAQSARRHAHTREEVRIPAGSAYGVR